MFFSRIFMALDLWPFWVNFYKWKEACIKVYFFAYGYLTFEHCCWKCYSFLMNCLCIFVKNQFCGPKFGLSILFHWSIYQYSCQYHTVLITVALWWILKLESTLQLVLHKKCFGHLCALYFLQYFKFLMSISAE